MSSVSSDTWQQPISGTSFKPVANSAAAQTIEAEIRARVRLLMHPPSPDHPVLERRHNLRQAFPYPVRLTPLDSNRQPLVDQTIVVIGRHLSELGFDFYYMRPVPFRLVVASFEVGPGRWIGFMFDLTWCRFGRHGYYESGGQFLRVVESPLSQPTS